MILDDLYLLLLDRKKHPAENSYVSSLFSKGKDEILKKIGEESIEVIIASKARDRDNLIHEIADLWFHCLVLMSVDGIHHDEIFRELERRFDQKRSTNE